MAGLLDIGSNGGGGLYGDVLTPDQQQGLQQRGLLGFLQGMAPYMGYSRLPTSFPQALAAGAGGMGQAQDAAALNALKAQELGLNAQMTRARVGALNQFGDLARHAYDPSNPSGGSSVPQAATPQGALSGRPVGGGMAAGGALDFPTLRAMAQKAGFQGQAADIMAATSLAESSGNPNAVGDRDKGGSYGVTQINADAHGPIAKTALGDPQQAMNLAYQVSNGGTDFSPWTMFKNGTYKKFLPAGGGNAAPTQLAANGALPPGLLSGAAAPPAGGPSGTGAPQAPPPPSGAPAPSAAPAGAPPAGLLPPPPAGNPIPPVMQPPPQGAPQQPPMVPGGAMQPPGGNPGGINPRVAQAMAIAGVPLGLKMPDFINQAAGMPFVAPTAYQKALGANAADFATKPMTFRPGGGVGTAATGPTSAMPIFNPQAGGMVNPLTNTFTPTPGFAGGRANVAGQEKFAETNAANRANFGDTGTPSNGLPPNSIPGTEVSPGMTTVIPRIQEPAYSPKQLDEGTLKKWSDMTGEMTAGIGQAQQAEHRLMNIAQAFKMIQSGAMQTDMAGFQAFMKTLGLNVPLTDPAAVELALHENYQATLQSLGAVNKRFTQNEFRITSEQKEHPNIQPEANLEMLGEDLGVLRQMRGMGSDWLKAQMIGAKNPEAFQTQWLQANPLSKFVDATKAEIGPLKGMPGGPGLVTLRGPNGQTLRAIKTPDGQYLDPLSQKPLSFGTP